MSQKRTTANVCGKVCIAPVGDYFVTCSFDPNHVILRSKMPYHIIKCIKQHPNHNKIQCPYDSTEYIDPEEFRNHLVTCESKKSIFSDTFETASLKATGNTCNIEQTPYFHAYAPKPDEEWGIPCAPRDEVEDEPLVGVGRGVSLPGKKRVTPVKRGMGRAELLRHILKQYQEEQNQLGSISSSGKEETLSDASTGQFDDV
uniref:CHHC U11-48K-type domain-containing protein n=1 Tax=Cuerna arida TaxID=1464854 RepID=A0A1B6F5S8_9HEMI